MDRALSAAANAMFIASRTWREHLFRMTFIQNDVEKSEPGSTKSLIGRDCCWVRRQSDANLVWGTDSLLSGKISGILAISVALKRLRSHFLPFIQSLAANFPSRRCREFALPGSEIQALAGNLSADFRHHQVFPGALGLCGRRRRSLCRRLSTAPDHFLAPSRDGTDRR